MANEHNVQREAERFLSNFPAGHQVQQAVLAVQRFSADSLESLLLSLQKGHAFPVEGLKAEISLALKVANDYYTALMRKPGEKSSLHSLDEKASSLLNAAERYQSSLIHGFEVQYDAFIDSERMLANAEAERAVTFERKKATEAFQGCQTFAREMSDLGIEIGHKENKRLAKYGEKLDKIGQLQEEIDACIQEYCSLPLQAESLKMMKKKVRNNLFSKSPLAKKCLALDYTEGLAQLKSLGCEVNYVLDNLEGMEETQRRIAAGMEAIGKYEALVKSPVSDQDIKELVGIKSNIPHADNRSDNLIYLNAFVNGLNQRSDLLLKRLNEMLAEVHAGLVKQYQALEPLLKSRQTVPIEGLKDLRAKFLALGEKEFAGKAHNVYEQALKAQSEQQLADLWNRKYPISDNIVYVAKEGRLKYDVRKFIFADDATLKKVIEEFDLRAGTLDETAFRCMQYVQDKIRYTPDTEQSGFLEDWAFPPETEQNKKGDCEDGTNLMVSLMRNAGIPAYRVKNACGTVHYDDTITKAVTSGGHSWPIYLRETDNEWVILDWCFLATKEKIKQRPYAKTQREYTEVWFTFNDEHSWNQGSLEISREYLPQKSYVKPAKIGMPPKKTEAHPEKSQVIELHPQHNVSDFSLPVYMIALGFPDSLDLFKARTILADHRGTLMEKCSSLNQFLDQQKPAQNIIDIEYMKKLRYGLVQAVDTKAAQREIHAHPQTQQVIDALFQSLNKYIGQSEAVCLG